MAKGKVKWYNGAKGFGFIETENSDDIFVHRTGLVNAWEDLQEGQQVVFEVKQGEKGPVAYDVKPATDKE
jgi:CspA family cold shock protein